MRIGCHTQKIAVGLIVLMGLLLLGGAAPSVTHANGATFIVNSDDDNGDNNRGDGKCDTGGSVTVSGNTVDKCTFRAALEEANALAGPNRIEFNIRKSDGSCPSGTQTINASRLTHAYTFDETSYSASYFITDHDLTVDGYTQCGASPNTEPVEGNAVIKIEIRGLSSSTDIGLYFYQTERSLVRGVALNKWKHAVDFRESHYNTLSGSFLGLRANESSSSNNQNVFIAYATNNTIGGTSLGDRNIIVNSGGDGIVLLDGADHNRFYNNYVGVKQDGHTPAGNNNDTFDIQNGPEHTWIGGFLEDAEGNPILDENGKPMADPAKRNIIVYGKDDGIEFTHPTNNAYHNVIGNYVGVDAHGNPAPNERSGINVEDSIHHVRLYHNVVGNNWANGIVLWTADDNELYKNYIGVLPDGTPAPNGINDENGYGQDGIHILGGSDRNLIHYNVIAHNERYGIVSRAEGTYTAGKGYGSCTNRQNTFSNNSFYNNDHAHAIRLSDKCDQNDNIEPPTIVSNLTSASLAVFEGCENCKIEVFLGDSDQSFAEGKTLIASTTAGSNGDALLLLPDSVQVGDTLTATATDELGNTSEFGPAFTITNAGVSCGNSLPATSLSISKSEEGSQLSWTPVSGALLYNVYRSADPNFTADPSTLLTYTMDTSFLDEFELNGSHENYYYTVRAFCEIESADSQRVSAAVVPILPGWNLVSVPMSASSYTLDGLIGDQLSGSEDPLTADRILVWDQATQTYTAAWYCDCPAWGQPWANHWLDDNYGQSGINLALHRGFWIQNNSGETQYLTMLGTAASASQNVAVGEQWQLLGATATAPSTLDALNLNANGTDDPLTADRILVWDAETQTYQSAWFCGPSCSAFGPGWANTWRADNGDPSPIVIEAGMGFWYENRAGAPFTWSR